MKEINKVIDSDEKILWEGKPKFWPFFLSGAVLAFVIGLIWMGFLTPFILGSLLVKGYTSEPNLFNTVFFYVWNIMLIPFVLIGLWMLIGVHIYKWLIFFNLYYVMTNKRVIIQKGIIGRDFEYIDYDKITNAEVKVGFWDKVVGNSSGSIQIFSAGSFTTARNGQQIAKPYTLSNIENTYEAFRFLKKVSYDIKTDIEYPNKLRPDENPGYKTSYERGEK